MADNVTLSAAIGSGAVLATDDISSVHYPYSKIAFGADGTATVVTSTATNPFPVALSDVDNAVLDSIVTNTGNILSSLQLIDNAGWPSSPGNGPIFIDDADWTDGTSLHFLTGGVYQSSPQTITDGDTGPFQVTANGYAIVSVDGNVTVDLSATDNAVLDSIVTNTGNILSSLQLIDNAGWPAAPGNGPIFVDDADWTDGASYHFLTGGVYQSTPQTITDGDTGPLQVTANGYAIVSVAGDALTALQLIDDPVATISATDVMRVAIFDDSDAQITSFGGGTQYTEAATDTTITGTVTMWEDTSDTLRAASAAKPFPVEIITGGGSGGTSAVDDAVFTAGSGSGTPAMGFFSTDTVASGDVGVLAMDASRRLLVSIEADNVGIGGGTQYTEDAAAATDPIGNAMMVVREDARAGSLTTTDGDNVALRGNNSGELYVLDTDTLAMLTTIDADTGAIKTAVEIIDNAISGSEMQVDIVSGSLTTVSTVTNLSQLGGAAVDMDTGVRSTGTQRVTIATDDVVPVTNSDVTTIAGAVSGTEMQVDVVAALPAGTNAIGKLAANSGVDIGDVDVASTTAATTGGATPGKLISAASTNATSVKASAGQIFSLCAFNTNAAAAYLKLYNKASAPTVGTDTPVQVYTIPGATTGGGFVLPIPVCGITFGTGIALATTTGAADSDTGAVAASEVVVSYSYK